MNKVLCTIRELGRLNRAADVLKVIILVLVTLAIISVILLGSYTDSISKGLADNLIRLHVIANSDSPQDQALKRDVRDAVLSYMKGELDH